MKKGTIIITVVAILAGAGLAAYSVYMGNRPINQDRFSISGSGTVYAQADIANITVGLKTEVKKTAAEATAESTTKMKAIVQSLKELGIEDKDIKTTDYSLQPVYNWLENRGQVLQGYQVYQNVSVKVRALEKIGEVIAKTTEQGANQIGNVSFTIDDEDDLKNQARELAIQKAKEKAALIAEQTGMKLGKIKGVYESADADIPVPMYTNVQLMKESAASVSLESANIQTGQNEVKVEVTLTYEVK